jgi:hypothetical protein
MWRAFNVLEYKRAFVGGEGGGKLWTCKGEEGRGIQVCTRCECEIARRDGMDSEWVVNGEGGKLCSLQLPGLIQRVSTDQALVSVEGQGIRPP